MKYKSEVGKTLDNLRDQVSNLIEQINRSALSEKETKQFLQQIQSNVERVDNLVSLEENDFEQTSDAPAPGSVDAPTPSRGPSREEKNNYQTRRVEKNEPKDTDRVQTDGGHSRKKEQTERVEFDN